VFERFKVISSLNRAATGTSTPW